MTERGLPGMEGAPTCPFVAFEDDRESRSTSPDHRHRCYADLVPSPRAAAHQEAYCLSSAFPVCPTFQDWAKREAAHAKAAAQDREPRRGGADGAPGPGATQAADERDADEGRSDGPAEEWGGTRHEPPPVPELPARRNPPRDWAAPPPWATGAASASRRPDAEAGGAPDFLATRGEESRGLAGSAADRLAAGLPRATPAEDHPPSARPKDVTASVEPDAELGGLVALRRDEPPEREYLPPRNAHRPTVSSTRGRQRQPERDAIVGPSWERARRFEAYPTLRARAGLPAPPRLALLAGALAIAAIGLFFLPALLGVGGGGTSDESTAPSAGSSGGVASQSVAPSEPPAPSQQVYTIKSGDTLSKVATDFGLTLEELLAANPTITDPDKIGIGDELVIPTRAPDEFTDPSASPS